VNWIPIPGGGAKLESGGLIATLALPGPDWLDIDNRYNLTVFDTDENFEVATASMVTLEFGKEYAEEIIGDYLEEI